MRGCRAAAQGVGPGGGRTEGRWWVAAGSQAFVLRAAAMGAWCLRRLGSSRGWGLLVTQRAQAAGLPRLFGGRSLLPLELHFQ